ncbi:MAG: substrate-binding domain-containing protein [Devosia nanyangense]|nr:substrate-binding domain-containing protein [Devosia nanyangense]
MSDDSADTERTREHLGSSTALDVAKAAKVSRIMVSRAFNPEASVRPDKRQHILDVAASLGYHPDMAARAMVTRRSNLVAVVVSTLANPWEAQEIDALTAVLQEDGLAVMVFRMEHKSRLQFNFAHIRAYRPAAVIAYMDDLKPHQLRRAFGNSPAIYPVYGAHAPTDHDEHMVDRLHVEQHEGIANAVRLLAGTGRKRLLYVRGEGAASDLDRVDALEEALAEHSIVFEAAIDGNFDYATTRAAVINYWRREGQPDAIFAANDTSAFGAIDALRYDLGVSVPQQCAVVGFDNIREAAWQAYNLTTIGVDLRERVQALRRMVAARVSEPRARSMVETIRARLVVRGTA